MDRIDWRSYTQDVVRCLPHKSLERYCPGGYHPITLGDTLHHGRCKITNKLGYGSYSTVTWASLKIKRASRSTENLDEDPEVRSMKALEKHYVCGPQDRPRRFLRLLDTFHHEGPNSIHSCLVMELLGPSLSSVLRINCWDDGEFLDPNTILRSSQQLLEGIQFAHDAGISHGDICSANIAFTCNGASTDEELLKLLGGNPVTATYINKQIPRTPHLPLQLVKSTEWSMWVYGPTEDIRIIDWGLSFPVKETLNPENHTGDLRSPEGFFIHSIDSRQDLWQAGCAVYSLFTPFLTVSNYVSTNRYTPFSINTIHFFSHCPITSDLKW
ncbi:serine threonine kinase AGC family protein [Rutstroemia sp. NJR-2017a BVV2]|nr:serine threonine kinase AGC family protein [Rutstroemia sp. NJR-2017a BVV2]